MDRDIRGSAAFRLAEEFFARWMEPGFGQVTAAVEPSVRPDGGAVAVTGRVFDKLEGPGRTRIAVADDRGISVITNGGGSGGDDRCPRWSPDGQTLAFLSDRDHSGVFAIHLLRAAIAEATPIPPVQGTVEYCSWSPDGRHLLLGVAGLGADLAGGQGSGTIAGTASDDGPGWLPDVSGGPAADTRRGAWVYDLRADTVRRVSPGHLNIWEAAWLSPGRIAAVTSADPGEDAWYTAELTVIDIADSGVQVVFKPQDQLGSPAGSPTGHLLAVIEAACSDRWIVAGDLRLIDPANGTIHTVDTAGVDVTGVSWIDRHRLGYTGIRGLHTIAGHYDTGTGTRTELISTTQSSGSFHPEAAFAPDGTAALILESYDQPPAITLATTSGTRQLAALSHPGTDRLGSNAGTAIPLTWPAPDGTEIEGIVCRPPGDGPFPLVVLVHGGPVWAFTDRWLMRYGHTPLLVSHGYAVLHPNPRGSAGRGRQFASAVIGDMGGADTLDILAGIDALVERGIADPNRIGVMGGSYGGYMSSWIITQDQRFAAAVPMSPTTDWYSQHYTSNIGYFDNLFLADAPHTPGGKHHLRSPITHAGRVRTPTLLIAGARDRCTPPGQAVEFHNALLEHGIETELAIYPQEGHGIKAFPARIDAAARILAWFQRHMPA